MSAPIGRRRLLALAGAATRGVVVDKTFQPALGASLRQAEEWLLAYEDGQALVFNRASPPQQATGGGSSEEQAEGSG